MDIEVYEIRFSLDQPDSIGPLVLGKLQQAFTQAKTRTGRQLSQASHHVLVVDSHRERARYLEGLLSVAGYRCMVAATTVEAFTHILQGICVPFAIITGQEDAKQRFFLNRLFQRLEQRYDWNLLLIRLQVQPASQENLPSFKTPPTTPYTFDENRPALSPSAPSTTPLPMTSWHGLPDSSAPSTPIPGQSIDTGSLPGIVFPSPVTHLTSGEQMIQSTGPLSSGRLPPLHQVPAETPAERPAEKVPPNVSLEGQDIGRYHVVARLGFSQTSNTYQAYDRLREKDIALKALHTDSIPYHLMEGTMDEVHLFQQEASLMEHLEHPQLLRVLNTGRSYISGASFIYKTMLFCAGGSLAQWLREHVAQRVFSPSDVLPLIWQLADGLQYLHDHGLVYQNFKFSNILLKNETDDIRAMQIVLSDLPVVQKRVFLARSADAYTYVAPERWAGEVVPASDQYALAAITYELLAGRPPFQGSSEHTMKLLHTTMLPQPPSVYNAQLPPVVNDILLRALAKKPESRFASVAAFAQVFQHYFR